MAFKDILAALRKEHQDAYVDLEKECEIECWSTGHFLIDRVLGKGFPKGRIIELWGPEGAGKSTIALSAGKAVQKAGLGVLYVDYEHSFNKAYAEVLGLDMDKLIVVQPNFGEEGFEIMKDAIDLGGVGLIIVDSVAAIVPQKEVEGKMGHNQIGLQSMIITNMIKQLCSKIEKSNICMIGINQIRSTISSWGSGTTTPGGNALKFYASIRVKMAKTQGIKKETSDDGVTTSLIGHRVKFVTVKNKVAPPFRECMTDLYFGVGFDEVVSLINMAIERGIITKAGAYFKHGEVSYRGLVAIREFVDGNEALKQEIRDNVGVPQGGELSDTEGSGATS